VALVERAKKEKGAHLLIGCVADPNSAARTLLVRADKRDPG
jgi:hypothetical protein